MRSPRAIIGRGDPGSLVCVASIDGIRSSPYHASYGAAKAGLINLVKSMSVEWAGAVCASMRWRPAP